MSAFIEVEGEVAFYRALVTNISWDADSGHDLPTNLTLLIPPEIADDAGTLKTFVAKTLQQRFGRSAHGVVACEWHPF